MTFQHWLDRVAGELRRQRLPEAEISRLMGELSDHGIDLFQEEPGMEAEQELENRLGAPLDLAATAKAELQRRTFAGRRPVLTFLFGPLLCMILAAFGTFGIGCLFAQLFLLGGWAGGARFTIDYQNQVMEFVSLAIRFMPSVLTTWIVVELGRRSGRRNWSRVALGIVVFAALLFSTTVTPKTADHEGQWMFSLLFFATSLKPFLKPAQMAQALVPLILGIWLLRRPPGSTPQPAPDSTKPADFSLAP